MGEYVPGYQCLPNYERPEFDPEAVKSLQKPAPRLLKKRAAKADVTAKDRQQRARCRIRSEGKCEVLERVLPKVWERCLRPVTDNHHLIFGLGKRNKGRSIMAEHRLDVCQRCHADLHGHVLVPDGPDRYDAASVRYVRRKA